MIYVSQGHEKSIALEVFFKGLMMISDSDCTQITLVANKQVVEETLKIINISYSFDKCSLLLSTKKIGFINIDYGKKPLSTLSMEYILENSDYSRDILITLPTTKDQLLYKGNYPAGHTEFLRMWFEKKEICMLFSSLQDNALLISDHISLKDVPSYITKELIVDKVSITIENYSKYFTDFDEILFSGINPHAGENGILGSEDNVINEAMVILKEKYNIPMKGPLSGDTLHFHRNNLKQLLVYMYHDQCLPWFKAVNKTIGANISLGLPILRMSVDHGTAFDLYGKNRADYIGCYYLLLQANKVHSKVTKSY